MKKMLILVFLYVESVYGFGYMSPREVRTPSTYPEATSSWEPCPSLIKVKSQILDCKEAAVLCNALCGNHVPDHLEGFYFKGCPFSFEAILANQKAFSSENQNKILNQPFKK